MEHNTTILHRTSTPALFGIIFAACAVLCGRAYTGTVHGLKVARTWLKARHNFADSEEPVIMTGYQYICFGLAVCAVCLALSIKL